MISTIRRSVSQVSGSCGSTIKLSWSRRGHEHEEMKRRTLSGTLGHVCAVTGREDSKYGHPGADTETTRYKRCSIIEAVASTSRERACTACSTQLGLKADKPGSDLDLISCNKGLICGANCSPGDGRMDRAWRRWRSVRQIASAPTATRTRYFSVSCSRREIRPLEELPPRVHPTFCGMKRHHPSQHSQLISSSRDQSPRPPCARVADAST